MELNDICGPSLLVQAVHVLGNQSIHPSSLLQPRQALMRCVRMNVAELMPPCAAAPLRMID